MRRIHIILLIILTIISGCSKEYNVGKIFVVDETTIGNELNLSEMTEKLIKETKNIGIKNPENSNSTLKITLSEVNVSKDRSKIKNRYNIRLVLTATLKDNNVQIFQSDSSSILDTDIKDSYSQIKVMLYDALLKLDYQCTIRKYKEEELYKLFDNNKITKWQKETIIDEIGSRLTSGLIINYENAWDFLYNSFLKHNKQYGEKIIGIFSSIDFAKLKISKQKKTQLAELLIKYSVGKEAYIQIHTITILSKINDELSRAYIFTLSTGSPNKNIREHAKEVLNELEKNNDITDNTITSK